MYLLNFPKEYPYKMKHVNIGLKAKFSELVVINNNEINTNPSIKLLLFKRKYLKKPT